MTKKAKKTTKKKNGGGRTRSLTDEMKQFVISSRQSGLLYEEIRTAFGKKFGKPIVSASTITKICGAEGNGKGSATGAQPGAPKRTNGVGYVLTLTRADDRQRHEAMLTPAQARKVLSQVANF